MAALNEAPGGGPVEMAGPFAGLRRLIIILVGALALLVAGMVISLLISPGAPPDDLGSQVDARVNQLGVKPANRLDPLLGDALRVNRAISAGDFASARQIIAGVLGASQLQNWRFYPYDDFVADVLAISHNDIGSRLDQWVAQDGTDATPLLLRAKSRYDAGWAKRGHDFADKTSTDQMTGFIEAMRMAFADVSAALKLDQSNPYGYYLRLLILSGEGASPAFVSAYAEAAEKFPTYYPLHDLMLQTLQPRWGGSIPAMSAFVDKVAGGAPEFSPLRLLYVSLYRYLLSTGSINCGVADNDADEVAQCVLGFMNTQAPADLERHMLDSLSLYDHAGAYQFGLAIRPILSDMLATYGADMHAGAVLQFAATSMHSDTQLKQQTPGHNDYVVDELLAASWAAKGFYDNAIAKYGDALADIRNGSFPSDDERNAAFGHIYAAMSDAAARRGQSVDQIAFEKAAVLVGWAWDEDRVCQGYFQLKQYDRVVETCTEAIERSDNARALYWRGVAYDKSGRQELALADLKRSVTSGDYYSPYAVVDMSMIYFGRGDNQGALDALNSYPPLYDPSRTEKSQIAVAYNNRCYAYMQLGDLKRALDDCTQSLRYGSIPEAIRKQQELLALLSGPGKTS